MAAQQQPVWRRAYLKVRRTAFEPPEFDAPDPGYARTLAVRIWQGEYDWPGFVPRRGWRVIDVGANVGVFSVLSASRKAQVVAYEPHPGTFAFLQRNAGTRGVECHQAAVVGTRPPSGTMPLFVGERDTQHSLGGFGPSADMAESVEVPVVSITDVLAGGCDLLKLDCEGAEYELLECLSPATLRGAARIVAELHGDGERMRGFERRLADHGYRVRSLPLEHPTLRMCFARRIGPA